MRSKRPTIRQCKNLAKQHVDDPDEPAAPDGDSGFAEWVQIALILLHAELGKSLRETEAWFNDSRAVREELNLDRSPDYTTLCRWEQKFDMCELRSLLRASAEQAGWTGFGAVDASGFQRDQTSSHYRNRANYSLQKMKTTILIDVETLAIKDVHFTTRKSWDGHIGMRIFRRNAEDLHTFAADKNYSWSDLREECRSRSTRPAIKHKEHNALKKAHNARIDDDAYHQRWMCETGFVLLKQDDGEKLRSRSWHGQFRELTRKCIVHNLSQAAS
jgi:IS5 family transposase